MKNLNLLTILFVCLKVANVIDWSWWVVLLPTIIGLAANGFAALLLGIVAIFRK